MTWLYNQACLKNEDEQQFLRWFHRMGIQRHLKVAGIFARLSHRDGKNRYLDDIPSNAEIPDFCPQERR